MSSHYSARGRTAGILSLILAAVALCCSALSIPSAALSESLIGHPVAAPSAGLAVCVAGVLCAVGSMAAAITGLFRARRCHVPSLIGLILSALALFVTLGFLIVFLMGVASFLILELLVKIAESLVESFASQPNFV